MIMNTKIHSYIIAPHKCLFLGDIGWLCFGTVLISLYLFIPIPTDLLNTGNHSMIYIKYSAVPPSFYIESRSFRGD